MEESLNLRAIRIFDTVREAEGTERRVLNPQETQAAQGKQQQIEDAFKEWIWKDQNRRLALVKLYNKRFNSTRPREYDGSHIQFHGMNPEITLRPHQRNAIAHILYGHNTLLGHVVGAGKTYEMVAAAMEKKRLGLCNKTLICVPNHLTEQMASEALQLYPNANILVAKRTDFEKANRKKFCGRIATGNYDIIVIGHSQFERIPLSNERQAHYLEKQIDEVIKQIAELKQEHAENFTVKQMERTRKQLEKRLEKLNNTERKDDVVTFEELGVDSLMVDEGHMFKNLMCVSKMRNVAGISQTESQRASDLLMKTMYLDEITGGRGVTFATGTPLSNSMTELYTMQRYLQRHTLEVNGLSNFDAWASTFGETVTAIELAPEGTGYRTKTRFAKFYNLPELMAMFKECADIQTADMLKLPVPELEGGKPINVQLQPSSIQRVMVSDLGRRADIVRGGGADPKEDNMLKITNDGRKLALDQRLIDLQLPDDPNSKVNACVDRVFEIWERTKSNRSTQLIFCDLSTPKAGIFNVYDDIRDKLVSRGIPKEEIQFIHDANTEVRKADLFAKVRSGTVRVLMGSTAKMGAGTNVQRKLIALHHLDVPWRPSDIEQREGRMVRQGNENKEVAIYRYVTEATFDAYSWQLIENKQRFIGQVMTSKSPARSCDDMDEAALSYAEVKALAAGNPAIKEKMDLDIQVTRLRTLKAQYTSQHYRLEDAVAIKFPTEIQKTKGVIANCSADANTVEQNTHLDSEGNDVVLAKTITSNPGDGSASETESYEIVNVKDASDAQIETQVLKFHNERVKPQLDIYKRDIKTGALVAGAVYNLITVDDIYSATGDLLFRAGDLIATSAPTDENGHTTFTCDFPMRGEFYGMEGVRIPENTTANSGKYRIVELRPPQGYYLDAPDQEFEFVYQDADTPVIEMENTFENDATSFFVSKRKLTGDEELPGATLTIQDKDGNVVRQWVSGNTPTEIRGLQFDKIYTLVETAAPNGYEVAESIRFKLVQRKDENGDLLNEADVYVCTGKEWLIFDYWTLMEDGVVVMRDAPSPETPPTPENPAPTPKPEQPVATPAPTPKPVTSLPQTGDNAPIGLLAGIAAAAGIAFGFLMHKRRRHNLPAEPEIEPLEDNQEEDHNG